MSNVTLNKVNIKVRGDTAANWSSANPILLKNEPGYDETNKKFKIGDGTTPWNSLSYVENGSSGGSVELEPIIIQGSVDFINGEYDLTFTDENYQQFLKNKTAPLSINDDLYYPYWDYGEQEDGGIYIYYRKVGAYHQNTLNEAIIAIYWLPNGETYVDETQYNIYPLEPINLGGSISFDNGFEIIGAVNITSAHHHQFLQNKNSPLCVGELIFNLDTLTDDGDGNYYAYYYYVNVTGGIKCYIGVCWETDMSYIDETYTELIRAISGGKFVLSYTVQIGERFDIPPTDREIIYDYGVENIIFKINDGEGYVYYYELTSLSDDGFYNFDQSEFEQNNTVLRNVVRRIELSNNCSTITHLSIPLEVSIGGSNASLVPINLGGTVTDLGDNFGIEDVVITQTHYQQFLQNKNAPILIGYRIFSLESITDEGDGNYYCNYSQFVPSYASKVVVVICWYNDESYVEECYVDPISGIKPIDIDKRITGWGEDFGLNNNTVYNSAYNVFLTNKYVPILVDNIVFQIESLVDNGDNTYKATYYYISVGYKHYVDIWWENNASHIDDNYIVSIGGSSGSTENVVDLTSLGLFPAESSTGSLTQEQFTAIKTADKIILGLTGTLETYLPLCNKTDVTGEGFDAGVIIYLFAGYGMTDSVPKHITFVVNPDGSYAYTATAV